MRTNFNETNCEEPSHIDHRGKRDGRKTCDSDRKVYKMTVETKNKRP